MRKSCVETLADVQENEAWMDQRNKKHFFNGEGSLCQGNGRVSMQGR